MSARPRRWHWITPRRHALAVEWHPSRWRYLRLRRCRGCPGGLFGIVAVGPLTVTRWP